VGHALATSAVEFARSVPAADALAAIAQQQFICSICSKLSYTPRAPLSPARSTTLLPLATP